MSEPTEPPEAPHLPYKVTAGLSRWEVAARVFAALALAGGIIAIVLSQRAASKANEARAAAAAQAAASAKKDADQAARTQQAFSTFIQQERDFRDQGICSLVAEAQRLTQGRDPRLADLFRRYDCKRLLALPPLPPPGSGLIPTTPPPGTTAPVGTGGGGGSAGSAPPVPVPSASPSPPPGGGGPNPSPTPTPPPRPPPTPVPTTTPPGGVVPPWLLPSVHVCIGPVRIHC